jgi:S-adenosylmethionine:tRNA ribosyltransferase-isomerase
VHCHAVCPLFDGLVAELVDAVDSKSTGLAHLGSTPSEATIFDCRTVCTLSTFTRGDFDFELPPDLIAQEPLTRRSASRLLELDSGRAALHDRQMTDLPWLLAAGDLLVFNDTRVVPARLMAFKPTGGKVELLLERPLAERRALVQLRDSKAVRAGMLLSCGAGADQHVSIVARREPFWEVELPCEVHAFFEAFGQVPLPPYINRPADAQDRERYQSLLARVPGAVAAPTASLHFDQALLDRLAESGLTRTTITLHVGAGTFQPLRADSLAGHHMHSERYEVSAATVDAVNRTRDRGGRVVAIGTTVARALESAALHSGGRLSAACADTALFIQPGFQFQVVDILVTNFHLPQSTLLMLVSAFAGREQTLDAYRHAVRQRYRFFSYGDAMLVHPAHARHAA